MRPPEPALQGGERVELLAASLREITRQNEKLFGELVAGERRFRGLARSVWNVQEAERRRLARDLHDGIGQTLTALKQQLDVVEQSAAVLPEAAHARLRDAAELAAQALRETRELSRLLRPQILDDLGLEPALRWLARTFGATHGIEVRLDIEPPPPALDGDRSTLVFRVVQEALTNVARHAAAKHVDISLRHAGGQVRLRIEDDGSGCDAAVALRTGSDGRGSGIGGMRDRVLLFNGDFAVHSQPGAGFRIDVAFAPASAASEPAP